MTQLKSCLKRYIMTNVHIISTASSKFAAQKIIDFYHEVNKSFLSLANKIRPQHEETLNTIIKEYGKKLNKLLKHYNTQKDIEYALKLYGEEIISVDGCTEYIAQCCRVNKRTILRHLDRLEEAGLIHRERKFQRLRLFINPNLIKFFEANTYTPITQKLTDLFLQIEQKNSKISTTENQSIKKSKTTTCRIMYITGNNKISLIANNVSSGLNTAQSNSETQILLETQNNISESSKQQDTIAARQQHIDQKALKLWAFAYENFYQPHIGPENTFTWFSIEQERKAINYFAAQLSRLQNHEIERGYQVHFTRLKLWKKFLDRDEKRFTPLPSIFFNPKNPQGYSITHVWQKENVKNHGFMITKQAFRTFYLRIKKSFQRNTRLSEIQRDINNISQRKEWVLSTNKRNYGLTEFEVQHLNDLFEKNATELINNYSKNQSHEAIHV